MELPQLKLLASTCGCQIHCVCIHYAAWKAEINFFQHVRVWDFNCEAFPKQKKEVGSLFRSRTWLVEHSQFYFSSWRSAKGRRRKGSFILLVIENLRKTYAPSKSQLCIFTAFYLAVMTRSRRNLAISGDGIEDTAPLMFGDKDGTLSTKQIYYPCRLWRNRLPPLITQDPSLAIQRSI